MSNQASGQAGGTRCIRPSAVSANLASYDYSIVQKLLAAFAIFTGLNQESPNAHQMSSAPMTLNRLLFEVEYQPEPSIKLSHTPYPSHGSCRLRLPTLVVSIRQASSPSAESATCDTVVFERLCLSPSRVSHHRSACPPQDLLRDHPHLSYPPNRAIVGTCKIAQTIAKGVQQLLTCCFGLGGCQSHLFGVPHIILLLFLCCLCIFNSLSCHSGLTFHIILDSVLLLFAA